VNDNTCDLPRASSMRAAWKRFSARVQQAVTTSALSFDNPEAYIPATADGRS